MEEYDTFYDKLKRYNNVMRLSVPQKLVEIAGFEEGDVVKIMIKKYSKDKDAKMP